jgi:hypothetical protein
MSSRQSDTATTITAILVIGLVLCACAHYGIDHTIQKIGIATIAALAGFAARGISFRP